MQPIDIYYSKVYLKTQDKLRTQVIPLLEILAAEEIRYISGTPDSKLEYFKSSLLKLFFSLCLLVESDYNASPQDLCLSVSPPAARVHDLHLVSHYKTSTGSEGMEDWFLKNLTKLIPIHDRYFSFFRLNLRSPINMVSRQMMIAKVASLKRISF